MGAVLIDDGQGARLAAAEAARLERLRAQAKPVGTVELVNTLMILEVAARKRLVADRGAMRDLYGRMRRLDDGLPPIEKTRLLASPAWA